MHELLRRGAFAVAAIALCAAQGLAADAVTVNKDHQGKAPSIAADAKGNLHLAYEGHDGKSPDIFYTASTDGGKTWSKALDVSNTPGISDDPAIACGKGGEVTIVWCDTSESDKAPADVFCVHSTNDGKTWSKAANISNTPGKSSEPAVAIAHDGTIHVVWCDTSAGEKSPDVWHTSSMDKGATWSKATNISKTPGISSQPAIACGPKGEVFVSWCDTSGGGGDAAPDVFCTASSDGGKTWSAAADVSNTPGISSNPDIGADDKGVYITWADTSVGEKHPDIFFTMSADGGKTWAKPVDISKTPGISSDPAISARDGCICIAWCDTSEHEKSPDVWTTCSCDGGKTFSAPADASNTPGVSKAPDVTIHGSNCYVAWEEEEGGKSSIKMTVVGCKK